MMSSNQDLIAEVAQSVLETMVFACSERSESFPAQRSEDYLLAEDIRFWQSQRSTIDHAHQATLLRMG